MFAASLPDLDSLDLETAKALLITQHQSYTATLSSRSTEVERLLLLVEKLQRMLFGAKSEKVLRQIEQLELQLEELQATNAIEEHAAAASVARPIAARPFRRPLPEHLPREIHTHMPDHEACPDCGGRLRVLGENVAEMLEHVRACFKVVRHVRPKMSCDACDRIVQAPAPSRPIDRGLAGPGLLAHVLVSKYADHLPLYRQSEIYAREGVDLDRSTLAGWVGATSELLAPLVEAVRAHVMSASKLHADDTPVPVLAPGNGKTRIGRLWTYVRDDRPSGDTSAPAVWFAYSPDRRGENPRQHLKHYQGALQADASPASSSSTKEERSTKSHVGPMPGASSTRSISRMLHRPLLKRSSASPPSMPSRPRSVAARRRYADPFVRHEQNHCSTVSIPGWKTRSPSSRASPIRLRRSAMQLRAGRPSPAMSTTAISRSTTTPPNARCALSPSDEKTTSSVDRTQEENAPPPFTRCSDQPSSTVSIQSSISTKCSNASLTTPSPGSRNCYLGTSP
jgi:transposase